MAKENVDESKQKPQTITPPTTTFKADETRGQMSDFKHGDDQVPRRLIPPTRNNENLKWNCEKNIITMMMALTRKTKRQQYRWWAKHSECSVAKWIIYFSFVDFPAEEIFI